MNALQKLGYPDNTKLLIIHADDAGLCHAENQATIQSLTQGSVNSFSIMVPCPGFEEMAAIAKENQHMDQGIHLTLTCEWKNFKWGTTSSTKEVSSLLDAYGNMYGSRDELKNKASIEDLRTELKSQIEKAIKHGVRPTHLDSHMYTLGLKPEFIEVYKSLGVEYQLPILLNRKLIKDQGVNPENCITSEDLVVDHVHLGNYQDFVKGKLVTFYENTLNTLPSGLNVILIHPAFDNQEMQDITIDHPNFGSAWRQIDFDFFSSEKCKSLLEDNNIELITWKKIKTILYPA